MINSTERNMHILSAVRKGQLKFIFVGIPRPFCTRHGREYVLFP